MLQQFCKRVHDEVKREASFADALHYNVL